MPSCMRMICFVFPLLKNNKDNFILSLNIKVTIDPQIIGGNSHSAAYEE